MKTQVTKLNIKLQHTISERANSAEVRENVSQTVEHGFVGWLGIICY